MENPKENLLRYPKNTYNTMRQLLNQQTGQKTEFSEFLQSNEIKQNISSIKLSAPKNHSNKSLLENTVKFALLGIAMGEMFSKFVAALGLLTSSIISDLVCILLDVIVGAVIILGNLLNAMAQLLPKSINNEIKLLSEVLDKSSYIVLCMPVEYITAYSLLIQALINNYSNLIGSIAGAVLAFTGFILGVAVGGALDLLMLSTHISTYTELYVASVSLIMREPLSELSNTASKTCSFWFPKADNNQSTFTNDMLFLQGVMKSSGENIQQLTTQLLPK